MKQSSTFLSPDDPKKTIELIIKIGLLAFLLIYCFMIIQPFMVIIIWALIIAIALYPTFSFLKKKMNGRKKLALNMILSSNNFFPGL